MFISWQRGSSKRGNTAPVNPTTSPGVAAAEYRFEDRLSISATLYSEVYKGKDDNSIGPFTDKWLILSLVGSGRGKKEQGQVVVNLAHYAAVHNEARQGFTVAVTDKKITQSLGEIVLEVTIGCRMRTKQKGKMTFTGTSNASSSGLQRTGSDISDSDYGSDYGDDGYGAPAGAIMESIREEDHSPGSARSQRHAEASRFSPGPLGSVPEPIPEQSASPVRQPEYAAKSPVEPAAGPVRPLAPHANAGKAAKYDEDGFLLDDEEDETPQPPIASRVPPPTRPITNPPKPPSEYDLAYDSSPAPSPRANQLTRNQIAIPEQPYTAAVASHQNQPPQQSTAESAPRDLASQISRLAEEESDEDDFLAAAVAAVEAQDKQSGPPASAQRAQQAQPARPAAPVPTSGQSAAAAPQLRQQPPHPQRPATNEAFLPSDDDASPMGIQNQQSRQGLPAIPPSIPKTWDRPSPQPRPSTDSENTPQRSDQSLRSRYGVQRSSPSGASDASAGAAAAFLAARTGSGTGPAVPHGQSISSRPLLAGETEQQRPGPVPIARPPTSAYNNSAASANSTASPASDAPRPSSKWFRKTPPVAPPAQPQPQVQSKAAGSEAAYNPFDSPTSQNGDGPLSPMALVNQQEQQQRQQLQPQQPQKPAQQQGMYMDESEEEEEQNAGRFGGQQTGQVGQRGFAQGQGLGQQPQVNRISPRGAITAGVGGTGAEVASVGPGSPPWAQQNGPSSPAYSDESSFGGERGGPARSPSQVERIRANMEAQSQNRPGEGFGPTHRPVIGVSHQSSPTLNKGVPDHDFGRHEDGQQSNGESGSSIRSWARKLDTTNDPLTAVRKAEEEERQQAQRRAQEEEQQRLQAQQEEEVKFRAQQEQQGRLRAEEEQQARRRAEEEQQAIHRAEEEQIRRRNEEQQFAKRRAEEEQQARRRAEEEQFARRRAEQEQQARRHAEEEQQAQRRAAEEERARREAEAEERLRLEAEQEEAQRREELEASERRRKRAEEEEAAWLRHDEEQKAAAAAAAAAAIAESAKSMATPQGMSRGSRDLGPRLEGAQEGAQGSIPPGFTYTQIESMVRELRTAAALEASVYLARSGKGNARRVKARSVHAPARRLARTTISLGPDEGIAFGLRAVRAIEAAADGCSDVIGMAYWWSNCIQLRWMLWAMCHGGEMSEDGSIAEEASGMDEFDWVMKVLVPPLRELEVYIFERLFRYLWQKALLESVKREPSGGPMFSPHMMTPTHKASQHEDAIQRWLDALQDTHRTLMPAKQSATNGHVTLLKQKMLTVILRRVDSVLFEKLTAGDANAMSPSSRDVFSSGWKNSGHQRNASTSSGAGAEAPLDPKLLPFSKGPLSFGVGVNLKMAVSRWTDWAHDAGVREEKGVLEGYSFFPQLRATADLLMMPKEVLTDRTIRAEVLPGLSLGRICSLLERFQPDDFAADPLPKGLLTSLHNETPPSEVSPSAVGRLEAGYEPPSESQLLADGLIEPVSLEMDAESDDELDALSEMYDPENKGDGTYRYTLLRELWSSAR
ncbi:hypothetical protein WJX77_004963 [Trebouxia sp. C0004]